MEFFDNLLIFGDSDFAGSFEEIIRIILDLSGKFYGSKKDILNFRSEREFLDETFGFGVFGIGDTKKDVRTDLT